MMSILKSLVHAVKRENFVILDTETTGLNLGEICSIAIINADGEALVNTLIKTQQPIPFEATQIHGITRQDVMNKPTWLDVQPHVKKILTGKDVIIYNSQFDRKMMAQSSERWGITMKDQVTECNYFCAMKAYAEFNGDWDEYHKTYRWRKLTEAHGFLCPDKRGIENGAHNPKVDCIMTLNVIRRLTEVYFR